MSDKKKFWKWKNQIIKNEDNTEVEVRTLMLNGVIAEDSWWGDEITPKLFKDELMAGKGPIKVWINSPGGDCIAAAQIYNMLIDYKDDVEIIIDGLAASAASVIAMAGTKVVMSPVALMMVHNPLTWAYGNVEEMQKAIDVLNEVKESIINAYEIKTGLHRSKISELMDQETWMNAKKAKELGFCDEIFAKDVEDETEPQMFSNSSIEKNLKNKLAEKYLIKKEEQIQNGLSVKEMNARLETIKKLI